MDSSRAGEPAASLLSSSEVRSAVGASWLSGRRAALAVLGIFLGLVMGALDNFVVLTALPNIVTDLHQPNGVTFVVSSYLITATVAIPIFGKLSDILSRRNVFLAATAIFVGGSVLAGLSQNLTELILFRGVQGFGNGGFFPVGIAIVATIFRPEMRARVTGVLSGVFAIGTVAGPFLGSYIVDHTTWRWVFYINIPVGLVGMGVIAGALGVLRPARRAAFDTPGAILLSAWVSALVFPLFQVSDSGWAWTDPRVIGLVAAAIVLFALFLVWEIRSANPLLPLRLFARRVVTANGTIALLRGFALFSLVTFIAVYVGIVLLSGSAGSADTVRNVLYFLVIPMVVGAGMAGQLLTRIAYRPLVAFGLGVATVGCVFLSTVSSSTPTWQFAYGFLPTGGIILPLIPIGFGLGLTFAPTVLAVQFQVRPQDVGSATSLVSFLQSLGAAIGISVLASLQRSIALMLQPTPPSPSCVIGSPPTRVCVQYYQAVHDALVTSFDEVFRVTLVLVAVALVFSFFLSGRIPKARDPSGHGPDATP